MPSVKYVGPFDEVEVPAAGVVIKRGECVDVPADIAKSLTTSSSFEIAKNKGA